VASLAAGATSSGTVSVTIPASAPLGTYYLLACADGANAVSESNEANNCLASASTIAVTRPDLVETAVSNPPASAKLGGKFSVTDTVANQGNATAASSRTYYYLSVDGVKDSGDKLLTGNRSVNSLAAGATSTGTVTVTIPTSTVVGTYYLLACADGASAVAESNETNNCRASSTQVNVTP
jgi:subtilase family serine protease